MIKQQVVAMNTPRQHALLAREDWRFHAIDTIGTGLGMIGTTEKLSGRNVSFGLPSAPALYLNLARHAHARRTTVAIETAFVVHPSPQGIWPEEHRPVFDFFEAFTAEVVFSFTAVEAFVNESIPKSFSYSWKNGKEVRKLSGADIERYVPLDEKLKRVLPQAHQIPSPAGTRPWQNFKELKKIRDRLVHMKSIDRSSSGPEQQTIWGLMLEKMKCNFPEVAYELIGTYKPVVQNRRWFRLARAST